MAEASNALDVVIKDFSALAKAGRTRAVQRIEDWRHSGSLRRSCSRVIGQLENSARQCKHNGGATHSRTCCVNLDLQNPDDTISRSFRSSWRHDAASGRCSGGCCYKEEMSGKRTSPPSPSARTPPQEKSRTLRVTRFFSMFSCNKSI